MAKRSGVARGATAQDVMLALRARFDPKAYAFFEEVGNATGAAQRRYAEALVMGLWPSRGLLLEGIEVKVSRSDWQNELKNPAKADSIAKYCDRWWLAVGEESIVKPGELPANWGLLVLEAGKMVCKVDAPRLEPLPAPRSFLAAILRRASENLSRQIEDARREGIEIGEQRGPEEHVAAVTRLQRSIDSHVKSIADFEQKSGIKLNEWYAGDMGDAVRKLLDLRGRGRRADVEQQLSQAADRIESQAAFAAKALRDEAKMLKKEAELAGMEAKHG